MFNCIALWQKKRERVLIFWYLMAVEELFEFCMSRSVHVLYMYVDPYRDKVCAYHWRKRL